MVTHLNVHAEGASAHAQQQQNQSHSQTSHFHFRAAFLLFCGVSAPPLYKGSASGWFINKHGECKGTGTSQDNKGWWLVHKVLWILFSDLFTAPAGSPAPSTRTFNIDSGLQTNTLTLVPHNKSHLLTFSGRSFRQSSWRRKWTLTHTAAIFTEEDIPRGGRCVCVLSFLSGSGGLPISLCWTVTWTTSSGAVEIRCKHGSN